MFSLRRYAVYLGLAVCALLIWNYIRDDFAQSRLTGVEIPVTPKAQYLPADSSNTRFQWQTVPTQYPAASTKALPTAEPSKLPKVQHDFSPETPEHAATRKERQAAVRDTFERSWQAYCQHAWMHDELAPLTGGSKDGFGGWAASLVDNLDNLWIMGLKKDFEDAISAAMDIDLGSATIDTVNIFETTIRHLGGFLSAYDLSGDKRCLQKAVEFGEMLYKAFDTPRRMPITRWRLRDAVTHKQEPDEVVLLAELGSFTMEFTRLSIVTGDPKWYDAVDRITRLFASQQGETHLPGMWPVVVDAQSQDLTGDTWFTLGAMADSVYEYFPKMQALLGGVDPVFRKLYDGSMATASKFTLFRPMVPDEADILVAGGVRTSNDNPPQLDARGEHLGCFSGGMYALGSKLFNDPSHLDIGRKLTDGCIWTYKALPLGVMPEVFYMVPCEDKTNCKWDEALWRHEVDRHRQDHTAELDSYIEKVGRLPKGFSNISDRRYILRPEAIESVFILYRITGEQKYQDAAWDMFTAIKNISTTHLANAALADITYTRETLEKDGANIQMDSMESFWMAETLKYFYLIFSEPDVISLDEWVLNTEAHPFKRNLPV